MALGPDKVRLQISVSKETAEKIEELAARLNMPATRLAANLLDMSIEDNEWLIRHVIAPARKLMEKWGRTGQSKTVTE